MRADTLEMQEEATDHGQPRFLAIPTASIDRVERWRGKKGNGRRGMVIGLVLGASVGALLTTEDEPLNAVVGGLGGIAWGGLVGSAVKTDRWDKLTLSPAVR